MHEIKLWYLVLFALIQFPLRFNEYTVVTYIFIYLIPGLYLLWHTNWTIKFFKKILTKMGAAVAVFIYLLLISCIWPIVYGTYDFTFLTAWWFKLFLLIVKNVFLVALYEINVSSENIDLTEYIYYFLYSIVLYVAFSSLLLVFDGLRYFCINNLYLTKKELLDLQYPAYFTRFGWTGWAGFDVTMQCSLAVFFSALLIVSYQGDTKRQMKPLFLAIIALIGSMLYGRTGLVVSLVIMILTILYSLVVKGNITFFLRCVFGFTVGLVTLYIISTYMEELQIWFNWAFSLFINFFIKGKLNDNIGSMGHLVHDMYWMPSASTFLFGDGVFTQNGFYYMQTDSGVMRLMLYYGIINYVLGVFSGFLLMKNIGKRAYNQRMISFKDIRFISLLILIMVGFFEFKGEAYYKMMCIILPMAFLGYTKVKG